MPRVLAGRLLLLILALNLMSVPAFAARFVPIKISIDGEVLLEGNASDDGRPDADQVWEALKQVNLEETEAFKKQFGKVASDEFKLLRKQGERGQPRNVTIDVAYGGLAETASLTIRRMPPDGAGRVWRIRAEDVDTLFNNRLIRRSDAATLSNPKRSK